MWHYDVPAKNISYESLSIPLPWNMKWRNNLLFLGRDRLPCLSDRPNLSYTEAVLHESMRLFNVVPTGIMHATTCDTEVGKDLTIKIQL